MLSHKVHTNAKYAHMAYMKHWDHIYAHYTGLHMYTYTNTCTNIYRHINEIAHTHITSFPIFFHLHDHNQTSPMLFVGCLTSQQHASVSQGWICSDNLTCCHTEIEFADHTFHLTQSQYTGTGPTSPSADPITPGAWQGSHWSANI